MEERPYEVAKRRPPTSQGEKPQKKSKYRYLDLSLLSSRIVRLISLKVTRSIVLWYDSPSKLTRQVLSS